MAEPGKSASSKSYVWVTTTAEHKKDTPIAIYNYTQSRSQTDARAVLKGFSGYIMCDGYAVYDSIAADDKKTGARAMDVKAVACLVHVRRKFADALKLLKPLLEDFFAWVKTEYDIYLHETHYGRALEYAIKEEKKVMRVLEDGRLELDNNLVERTVKPFVIGRKNWLFADTPQGAEASCIIYSIVQTAIMNHLIPFEYIKYLLEQMPGKGLTDKFIETLLPWSGQLPEYVKVPSENTDI